VLATRDIGLAVMATTLSLVVIFLPVSFMSSVSGRFLYSFGVTAAVAILVSLLVSLASRPMMSSRMLSLGQRRPQGKIRAAILRLIDPRLHAACCGGPCIIAGQWRLRLVVMASCVPLYRFLDPRPDSRSQPYSESCRVEAPDPGLVDVDTLRMNSPSSAPASTGTAAIWASTLPISAIRSGCMVGARRGQPLSR